MRDLFEQINGNNLNRYERQRKPNKGSKLARFALKEAMGDDDAFVEGSSWSDIQEKITSNSELEFEGF